MTEIDKNLEEKIDYIYREMKKNQKKALIGSIFKWSFRAVILGYLYYFFFVSLPSIIDKIPSFGGDGGESVSIEKLKENPQFKELYDSYFK